MQRTNYYDGQRVFTDALTHSQNSLIDSIAARWTDLCTPGVVDGLSVGRSSANTGRAFTTSGTAYDINGERVRVSSTQDLLGYRGNNVNAAAGTYILVARYQETNDGVTGIGQDGATHFEHLFDSFALEVKQEGVDALGSTDVKLAGITVTTPGGSFIINTASTYRDTAALNLTSTNSGSGASSAALAIGNSVTGGGSNRVLFENAAEQLAASSNLTFDGTVLTAPTVEATSVAGQFVTALDTVAAPQATITSTLHGGFQILADTQLPIQIGGMPVALFGSNGLTVTQQVIGQTGVSTNALTSAVIAGASGLAIVSANTSPIAFTVNSTAGPQIARDSITSNIQVLSPSTNPSAPSYGFSFRTRSGMYDANTTASNAVGFAVNGTLTTLVRTSALQQVVGNVIVPDGSSSSPCYSFTNDGNSGIHSNGNDSWAFNAGGSQVALVTPGNLNAVRSASVGPSLTSPGATMSVLGVASASAPVMQLSAVPSAGDFPTEQFFALRGTTTDATPTTIGTWTIDDGSTVNVDAKVLCRRTGGSSGTTGDSGFWRIFGTVKRNGGGAAGVGATAVLQAHTTEDQVGFNATFNVSGNNTTLDVTGTANNNITWHATVRVLKLSS